MGAEVLGREGDGWLREVTSGGREATWGGTGGMLMRIF